MEYIQIIVLLKFIIKAGVLSWIGYLVFKVLSQFLKQKQETRLEKLRQNHEIAMYSLKQNELNFVREHELKIKDKNLVEMVLKMKHELEYKKLSKS